MGKAESTSVLFKDGSNKLYRNDYENAMINSWYFNEADYNNAISSINSLVGRAEDISAQAASVSVSLESPEGKELEGQIKSCFSNISSHVGNIGEAIWYCGAWGESRYWDGVVAEETSLGNVKMLDKYRGLSSSGVHRDWLIDALRNPTSGTTQKLAIIAAYKAQFEELEELLSRANPGSGRGTTDVNGNSLYKDDTFVETARNCWERLYFLRLSIGYDVGDGNFIPFDWSATSWNSDGTGGVNCSSFVSWVLYEYGYDAFGNRSQRMTWDMIDSPFASSTSEDRINWSQVRKWLSSSQIYKCYRGT